MRLNAKTSSRLDGWKLTLLLCLLNNHLHFVKSLETEKNDEDSTKTKTKNLDARKEDLDELRTNWSLNRTESPEEAGSSTIEKKTSPNATTEFRPSAPLEDIQEPRRKNPFNNVHHVEFEASIEPQSYEKSLQSTDSSPWSIAQPVLQEENVHRQVPEGPLATRNEEHKSFHGVSREKNPVKFQDESDYMVTPRILYQDILANHRVQPINEGEKLSHEVVNDHTIFQDLEKPIYEQASVFERPTKLQGEAEKQDVAVSSGIGVSRLPYYGGYEYNGYQPVAQDFEAMRKPENDVVYVHQLESSFTRTRKFPYPYYQSPVLQHDLEYINDVHPMVAYPQRRISPWKKIIHLIGTFLPLGLLLATLTPNVVKIDNTTQPNIVLSKLRVADLPAEHKQVRLSGGTCEGRSICEKIMAGGKERSDTLQNILWNLTRATEETTRENELREIFEAVKRKDCASIAC